MVVVTLVAALILSGVHLLPRYLDPLLGDRRPQAISVAGGFSVAFVFVYLVPELEEAGDSVQELVGWIIPFYDHDVYLLTLLGLVVFYGLERAARVSPEGVRVEEATIAVFSLYYAVIGYLLWDQRARGMATYLLFAVAMGLHFLVVDYGLREHHRAAYGEVGRWILGAAVLVGWLVGLLFELSDGLIGMMLGFIAGGIVLIALKEELPTERQGRFGAFTLGAAVATLLLVAL